MLNKAHLRNLYLHKRDVLTKTEQASFNRLIADKLYLLLQDLDFSTIHTYLPQAGKNEIDTLQIISMIRDNFVDAKVVVPRIIPGTKYLEHYFLTEKSRLILNRWLIPEPVPASSEAVDTSVVDVVLIPLLAFDMHGYRVGYGGGFYDRFLAECRPETIKIGLSFFEPIEEIEDINNFDIPLDFCVTPDNTYRYKR